MTTLLSRNLKKLRKNKQLTQSELADKLGVNRSVIGAYEEGRAEPRLSTLVAIAHYFQVSVDALLLREEASNTSTSTPVASDVRVLPITVDRESDRELITVVPQKAAAGYLVGFGDIDFIASLPRFSLPIKELAQDRTYRAFQIKGDSMAPLPSGSYVVCSYVDDWATAGSQPHVVVTRDDGVVFKQLEVKQGATSLTLHSTNTDYPAYDVDWKDVVELWKAQAYISFGLPEADTPAAFREINQKLEKLQIDVSDIKKAH
jgi:transcriptional regulator with XRE-family HTH domain